MDKFHKKLMPNLIIVKLKLKLLAEEEIKEEKNDFFIIYF
jgi:hypothetical protein